MTWMFRPNLDCNMRVQLVLLLLTLSCSGNSAAVHSLTKQLEYVSVYFHRTALVSTSNHLQLYECPGAALPADAVFPPRPANAPPGPQFNAAFWGGSLYRYCTSVTEGDPARQYGPQCACIQPRHANVAAVHGLHPGDIICAGGGTNNVNNNRMFLIQPYRTTTDLCSTQCHCEHVVPSTDDSHPAMGEQRPDRSSPSGGTSGSWLQSPSSGSGSNHNSGSLVDIMNRRSVRRALPVSPVGVAEQPPQRLGWSGD